MHLYLERMHINAECFFAAVCKSPEVHNLYRYFESFLLPGNRLMRTGNYAPSTYIICIPRQ